MSRFSKQTPIAGYQPMSFQELAFAPIQMRQREDRYDAAKGEILKEINNMEFDSNFQEEGQALRDDMIRRQEELSNKMRQKGVGYGNISDEFSNLRNDYNKLVSKNGALGKASGLKATLDTQKAAFWQMGMQRNQSEKDIQNAWDRQEAEYRKQLPSSLSKHDGALPAFNPGIIPEGKDIVEHLKPYASLIGTISDKVGGITLESRPDPDNPGMTKLVAVSLTTGKVTNEPGVTQMIDMLKNEVLDPNSTIAQDMAFKGYGPKDVIEKLQKLGNAMISQSTTEMRQDVGGNGGGGNGSGRTGKPAHDGDTVELQRLNNSSEKLGENITTVADADRELSALERGVMSGGDTQDAFMKMNAIKHNKKALSAAENAYKETSQYQEDINNAFTAWLTDSNSVMRAYGVTSLAQYNEIIENPEILNQERNIPGRHYKIAGKHLPLNERVNKIKAEFEELDRTVLSKEISPYLIGSEQMVLGQGPADKAVKTYLKEQMNGEQIRSFLKSGLIERDMGESLHNTDFQKLAADSPEAEDFMEYINNPKAKYEFSAINTGNTYSKPEMQFTVSVEGEDDVERFTIDLGDNDFTNGILDQDSPIFKSMSPESKRVLMNMKENISYRGTPASLYDEPVGEQFADYKQAAIKENSKKRAREIYGYNVINKGSDKEKYTDLENIVLDSQFIKPFEDAKLAVVINEDGSYSSSKKVGDKIVDFTIGDYYNQYYAGSYTHNNVRDPGQYSAEFYNSTEGKEYKNRHKVQFLETILENTTDLTKPSSNMLIYADSAKFKNGLIEYDKIRRGNVPYAEKVKLANKIYDTIADLPVQSKRINQTL